MQSGGNGPEGGNSNGGYPSTPWNKSGVNSLEAFFHPDNAKIIGENWNKFFPYRLLVVDVSGKNITPVNGDINNFSVDTSLNRGEDSTTITVQPMGNTWSYTFPISPARLSITTPFAIRTTSTLQGVLEEHNGTKFKIINIAGTTGIWANRPNVTSPPAATQSITSTLFSNSIDAIKGVADSVNRIKNIANGDHPAGSPKTPKPKGALLEQTGYYQAQLLSNFFEQYSIAKKDPKNKGWRLVFNIPKQNKNYIVTPVVYTSDQSKERPAEWMYNIQLKAWKTIDLDLPNAVVTPEAIKLDSNSLQRIIGSINESRRLIGKSLDLIKAVRSDFQKPLNALRQTALLVKDTVGLATSAADLPRQIVGDFSSSIKESLKIIINSGLDLANLLSAGAFEAIGATSKGNEGLSDKQVKSGALGKERIDYINSDPADNIFIDPERSFEFFNSLDTGIMNLSQKQQDIIDNELTIVRNLTVADLKDMKATILGLALAISDQFGSGDSTFSKTYSLPEPKERAIEMTVEENELIASIYEVIQGLDYLTANKTLDNESTENSLEYVGGLASDSGIAFELSNSKFLVPVPFNKTIEQISLRYLNDANRWTEISTLNNLKSPYIDEDGFYRDFLSNGDGRQFNIDSKKDLYIGQKINMSSATVPSFIRRIQNIEEITSSNFLITVDGLDNLDSLKISESAKMTAFLPGTVNSQNTIYIPSDEVAPDGNDTFSVPYLKEDDLTGLSKIDWLLTEDGDLATDATGDIRLANGMTNIIQAIRQKIVTKKSSLLRHPEYGLGITPGTSHADISSKELFKDISNMIASDPRFSTIEKLVINIKGPVLSIRLDIRLAGNKGLLPIDFKVAI